MEESAVKEVSISCYFDASVFGLIGRKNVQCQHEIVIAT